MALLALIFFSAVGNGQELPARARGTIEKALPGILRGSLEYPRHRSCFSCHHQALPLAVLASAKIRGFTIDAEKQRSIVEFSLGAFAPKEKHERLHKGLGHRTTVIGYLLATLAIADSRKKALRWLNESEPNDTEDRVFQLRGLVAGGAEPKAIRARRDALAKEQRADGSWSQLPDTIGDAYATGSALVALREAGMAADDPIYAKGIQFLLETQKPDGFWHVETRARPVQLYFDNGDPGGRSQFITFTATNWAVLALLETIPIDRKGKRAP